MRKWGGTKRARREQPNRLQPIDFILLRVLMSAAASVIPRPGHGHFCGRGAASLRPTAAAWRLRQACTCCRRSSLRRHFFIYLCPRGFQSNVPGLSKQTEVLGPCRHKYRPGVGGGGLIPNSRLPRTSRASFPPAVAHLSVENW